MSRTISQKQIKALLKVMWHDETRPVLASLAFKDKALVATDGYVLVALNIESDWQDRYGGDEKGDYIVPMQKLKDWCKTHTSKAELSVEELWDMAEQLDYYPEWRRLSEVEVSKEVRNGIFPQPLFNTALLGTVMNVFLNEHMTMSIYGEKTPLKLSNNKGDIALVMPLAKK